MTSILALCHGRKLDNPPGTKCRTALVNIKNAVYIDKDKKIKPHILQDLKKPFDSKKKYDIITTVCCVSDVFFDDKRKCIEQQTFRNISSALEPNGIFIMPKYYWVKKQYLLDIQNFMMLIKKVKTDHHQFYIFQKKVVI